MLTALGKRWTRQTTAPDDLLREHGRLERGFRGMPDFPVAC